MTEILTNKKIDGGQIHNIYHEEAFQALRQAAPGLFQARKCGVIVTIPHDVRVGMLATHGSEAQIVLDFLDGNVDRYMFESAV